MHSEMSLRIQTTRRKLSKHNLSWKEIEAAADNILTATSEKLGINHNWTFNYHYYALRAEPTIVLKATHRDLPHAVAVKYLHESRQRPTSPAQSEFATLSNLHTRLGPQHESVVTRPYAATRLGYSCEWVDLPSMKTVLLTGTFSAARRQRCIEAAAASLRLIHNALSTRVEPLNTNLQIERLNRSKGTSSAWKSAFEQFLALSQELDGKPVRHGVVHADFTPGNILLGPNRCVVFDFGRHHENGPIYSDIAYFLAYVIAYCTFGPNGTAHDRTEKDLDAFMNAYGLQETRDLETVRYTYLTHLLKRWAKHETKSLREGRSIHLRAYDRFAARRIEQLFADFMRRCF